MKNPIKYSFKTEIWPVSLLFLSLVVAFWAYTQLPEQVITHWNFAGEADGWSSRLFHSLFFPGLIIFIYLLLTLMPKFDPMSERYQEFSKAYLVMRNLILSVMFIIFAAATLVNLGYNLNIGIIVTTVIGLLMIILGFYFRKIKRNFFVGIRTSWTISSEKVWDKTHHLGSYLFVIWGILLVFTPYLNSKTAIFVLLGGAIFVVFTLFVYSYWLYSKEKKEVDKR